MSVNKRNKIVGVAKWAVAHNATIGYPGLQPDGQTLPYRPMPWMDADQAVMAQRFGAGNIWYPDCSAFVTWCFKQAGFADPNGLGYSSEGDSLIMWTHLIKHYTNPARAGEGAIITYGTQGVNHVCFVVVPGKNPMVCSHGSAAGPIIVDFEAETAAHPGQTVTFLDVTPLT